MTEAKIARTVAEAQVGDLLWLTDPYNSRRRPWSLVPVRRVGRDYVYVGLSDHPRGWYGYSKENGGSQPKGGYTSQERAYGYAERERLYWHGLAREISRKIEQTEDVRTLRDMAFLLGIEGPPDYSAIHDAGRAALAAQPGERP